MKNLTINVHFKCNARCIFCVVGIPEDVSCTSHAFSFQSIVDELAKGRKMGCDGLCLSGGEPTIYKGITNVVKEAKEMGYKSIEIKSNGLELDNESFVRELVEAGIDVFCISIQGHTAVIHDKVIGVKGGFNRILNAIDNIHKYNAALYTPTCIQQANYKFLPEIAKFYKKIGSDSVCPTFIEPNGSANEHFNNVVPLYSEVMPYLYDAIKILEETNISWCLHGFPLCIIKGYESRTIDFYRGTYSLAGTEIEDYTDYERMEYRVKSDLCKRCTLFSVCGGPWKNYVKKNGFSEFEPIENVSIADIIPSDILVQSFFASS